MRQALARSASKPERRKALRLFICAALAASCGSTPEPSIVLVDRSAIEIRGVPAGARPSVHVNVGEALTRDMPVAGSVQAVNGATRFVPMFPLEPGRAYLVRAEWAGAAVQDVVRVPARAPGAPVRVTAIQPALDAVPENLLRIYIHFSGPMGRGVGSEHVRLLDADGREIVDPFLPVDGEFWNGEHTRYTLFFDPGRVKTGILPNERMGRPLRAGRRYTLVVARTWTDAEGRPLAEEFRRGFTAGPAIAKPLDPAAWPIDAPRAGSREPMRVRFPHALDSGLLQRAIGIEFDGRAVEGAAQVSDDAKQWSFTPAQPWAESAHHLVVLTILEDPSGNRVGRAFEVEGATRAPSAPDRVLISWTPSR